MEEAFLASEKDKKILLSVIGSSQGADYDSSGDLKRWLRQLDRHQTLFSMTKVISFAIMVIAMSGRETKTLLYGILMRTFTRLAAPQLALAAQLFINEVYNIPLIGPIMMYFIQNVFKGIDYVISKLIRYFVSGLNFVIPFFSYLVPTSLNVYPKAFMMGNDYYSPTSMAADTQSAVAESYMDYAKQGQSALNTYNKLLRQSKSRWESQQEEKKN